MLRRDFLISLLGTALLPALASCSATKTTNSQSRLSWRQAPKLPVALQEVYPALFQGDIYVAGAFQYDATDNASLGHLSATRQTHIYDIKSQSWRAGPDLPASRHHLGLVANGERLYGIGGFDASKADAWQIQDTVFVLTSQQSGWQYATRLPNPQAESVYGVLNGEIHVIGGRAPKQGKITDTDKHWRLVDDQYWESAAPLSVARNSAAACVMNNQLYMLGGRINRLDHKNLTLLSRYDANKDNWQLLAPLPQATAGLACAVMNGQIYAFGGEEYNYFSKADGSRGVNTRTFNQIWRYDPKQDSWHTETLLMTSTRHGLGAVTVNNEIYLLGGAIEAGATGTTDRVEILTSN